ncbi:MAG: DsbC family protein [Salinisphaeraceae bacterium]
MSIVRFIVTALTAGLIAATPALSQPPGQMGPTPLFEGDPREITSQVVPLPGTDISAVDRDGNLVLITSNKRYAVVGKVIDLLERKELRTIEDIKQARRLDFKGIGIDFTEMGAVTFGNGPKEVIYFVDPYCPHCNELLKQSRGLFNDYTFRVVLVPLYKGPVAADTSIRLVCNPDQDQSRQALFSKQFDKLPAASDSCDRAQFYRNAAVAQLLNVEGVPFVYAPNGEPHLGTPRDLAAFLEDNA